MSDVTRRALRLLALLQSRAVWSGEDLASELGVTVRSVRRDVERLRELGYPVQASAGVGGGYQLGAGRALPPLVLEPDEAVAVTVGLRLTASSGIEGLGERAARALAKLDPVLPAPLRAEVSALGDALSVLPVAVHPVDATVLTTLARAVRDRLLTEIAYERRDGERSERRLEPYRVLTVDRRWYLFAWDLGREDWRTFRLDRMHAVRPTTFRFPARPTPDIDEFVHRSLTTSGYASTVRVRVLRPRDEVALMIPPLVGRVVEDDETPPIRPYGAGPGSGSGSGSRTRGDGGVTCILEVGAMNLRMVALHLAVLGLPIEVLDPAELLEEFSRLADWFGRHVEG